MGYSGLNSWQDVDGAADLRSRIMDIEYQPYTIYQIVDEELKDKGNEYNPSGSVNCALLIESGDLSIEDIGEANVNLILNELVHHMEEINDEYHDMAYIRLYSFIKQKMNLSGVF